MSNPGGLSIEELNNRHCKGSKVEIKLSKIKGRYVVSKERLEKDEPFFVSFAYSNVIQTDMVQHVCAQCRDISYEDEEKVEYNIAQQTKKTVDMQAFIKSRKPVEPRVLPVKCEKCLLCYYCSEECKEEHSRAIHEYECEYFNKIRLLEIPDVGLLDYDCNPVYEHQLLRHLVRVLVKRYYERNIGANASENRSSYNDVLTLIFKDKASDEHLRVAELAKDILPTKFLPENSMEIVEVLSRIDCNKFGIFGRRGHVFGSSLNPSASFVNHSCLPNSYSHVIDNRVVLYTLYPVEAGEEMNISYIDAEAPIKERRGHLKEVYGFECICRRCCPESGKNSAPKAVYEAFFMKYLNCPLCKKGLMMPADEDDLRIASEELSKEGQSLPMEEDGITEFRACNGCHKVQLVPCVPSIDEYKRQWRESRMVAKAATKAQKGQEQLVTSKEGN